MEFQINTDFASLTGQALADYLAAAREAFAALVSAEDISDEALADAEALADHIDAVQAHSDALVTAAEERSARLDGLRNRFSAEEDEGEEDAEGEEEDASEEGEEDADEEDAEADEIEAAAPPKESTVKRVAKRAKKPTVPARQTTAPVSITAAADVPDFSTGQTLTMSDVGDALVARMRGFGVPTGDGSTESLQHYGVAKFRLDFPEELTVTRGMSDEVVNETFLRAGQESRLDGNSLTAAGGWCAPSETLYDLCTGESTEGILSVPEVNVQRGGIKYTSGPDFATLYPAIGFTQTEAQAQAGTTKACYEVACPPFTEVRLDAIGVCIKAPILTQSAYPELVQRVLTGSMVVHQHRVNASVISRMVTAAGAARVFTGLGSSVQDSLAALALVADQRRQTNRYPLGMTLEVVVPFWLKEVFRSDLSARNGRPPEAVTDAEIASHFSVRRLNVQYVYDWQDLVLTDETYPTTYNALVYPAGTFVKGTSDVITLNAVYDAASLATNVYTALFFEQGLLVAKMCHGADLVTLPICNAGRTGAANLTCA